MYDENVIDGLKRLDRVEEAHRPMCDPGELQRLVDRLKSPDIHAIHFVAGGTIQTFPTDRVFPSATITLDDLRELISDVTKDQPAEEPKPEGPGPVPDWFASGCKKAGNADRETLAGWVDELRAENERLRKRCHELTDLCDNRLKQRWDDNTEYRAEIDRLREALSYIRDFPWPASNVQAVARQALQQEGGER